MLASHSSALQQTYFAKWLTRFTVSSSQHASVSRERVCCRILLNFVFLHWKKSWHLWSVNVSVAVFEHYFHALFFRRSRLSQTLNTLFHSNFTFYCSSEFVMFHYISNMFLYFGMRMRRALLKLSEICGTIYLYMCVCMYVDSEGNIAIVGALLYNEHCCYSPG